MGGDFERRLMAAVAMGLAMGCRPAVTIEDDEDAATSGSSGESETTRGASTSSAGGPSTTDDSAGVTSSATVGGGTLVDPTVDEDPRFDIGGLPPALDVGGEYEHECQPVDEPPACDVPVPDGLTLDVFCREPPQDETCAGQDESDYLQDVDICISCIGLAQQIVCEPFQQGDMCCTWALVEFGIVCPGRPFVVRGDARVPSVVKREDWTRHIAIDVAGLDRSQREVLAAAWASEGCHEAASVASFSRFILQLVALGAPPELIARAHAAVADEIEHARTFFGFSAAYGGTRRGPGALPIEDALEGLSDPVAIAVSLANEGCIAETISAMQIKLAAERASDPALAHTLHVIAEEELQHAELAWAALGWMLSRGDDRVRSSVADTFVHARRAVPRSVSVSDVLDPDILRRCGRLDAAARLRAAEHALATVIAPAAAQLLDRWTVSWEARSARETTWS